MPKKNALLKFQNINAGDMSANITSVVTNIQFLDNVGVELDWTGTPTGTVNVQVSVSYAQDAEGNVTNAGTWNNVALNPSISIAGSAGSQYIDLNQLAAPWVRIVYTFSSGTGALNGYISAKEI